NHRSVPSFLKWVSWVWPRSDQRIFRVDLVRAIDLTRAGNCCLMIVFCSAFCSQQIIIVANLVKVGRFGQFDIRAFKDDFGLADELASGWIEFLQDDAVKRVVSDAMVPVHIDEIFFPGFIVEEGRVES